MTRERAIVISLALVAAVFLFRAGRGGGATLDYVADWDSARAESRETGKPVFLNFGGPW